MLAAIFAAAAGLGVAFGVAFVLAVYRRGDIERVARECATDAVSKEREEVERALLLNAAALGRAGKRQHAKTVRELVAILGNRPNQVDVKVQTKWRNHGQAKEQDRRSVPRVPLAAAGYDAGPAVERERAAAAEQARRDDAAQAGARLSAG